MITHSFVSGKSDGADNTLVQPSAWNAEHVLDSGLFIPRKAVQTFHHADIVTWPTTPLVVIPATETLGYSGTPTTLPIPVYAMAQLNTQAGAYTNVHTDVNILLAFGSDWSDDASYKNFIQPKITVTRLSLLWFQLPKFATVTTLKQDYMLVDNIFVDDNLQDNALAIACDNPDGDFSDGHADNILTVTVFYYLLAL